MNFKASRRFAFEAQLEEATYTFTIEAVLSDDRVNKHGSIGDDADWIDFTKLIINAYENKELLDGDLQLGTAEELAVHILHTAESVFRKKGSTTLVDRVRVTVDAAEGIDKINCVHWAEVSR